jgi:hypothetical protein
MTWIFEQPLTIVLISVALLTGIAVSWVMSGHKGLLYALIGCSVLAALLLIAERMVVTDRESIEETVQRMARDVASNVPAKVTQHISPAATELLQRANTELPNYKFESMRITKVHKIDVQSDAQPKTAIVEFNILASGSFRYGSDLISDTNIPRWVQLELVKEDDGAWRIRDYKHDEPLKGMLEQKIEQGFQLPR